MSYNSASLGYWTVLRLYLKKSWVAQAFLLFASPVVAGEVGFLVVLCILVATAHWTAVATQPTATKGVEDYSKRELREALESIQSELYFANQKIRRLESQIKHPAVVIKVLSTVMGVLIRYDQHWGKVTAEQTLEVLRKQLYGLERTMAEMDEGGEFD